MPDIFTPAPPLTMRHAARVVIAGEVRALRAQRRGARRGDVAAVHQMRVASRRLRAALRVFDGIVQPPRRLKRRLERLAARLGRVRDRDVRLGLLLAMRGGVRGGERARLDRLLRALRAERRQALVPLRRRLRGARRRRLVRSLRRFADQPTFLGDPDASAPRALSEAVERLAARVAQAPAMTATAPGPQALHELRIGFKRLRYALEFHAETCGITWDAELKLARALQETLGALHDHDVLLAALAAGGGPYRGRWTALTRRLTAERRRQYRIFTRLRRRWLERTRPAPMVAPLAEPRFVALEPAPVTLRLITPGRQVASMRIR